jgi:hypothetical protein
VSTSLRLIGFAITGTIAGLLSCFVPRLQFGQSNDRAFQFLGAILGVLLPLYLWMFAGRRSLWRGLIFLPASTGAFYAAMTLALASSNSLRFLRISFMGTNGGDNQIMITGGLVGGAILYLAFALLYCRGIGVRKFFLGWPLAALFGACVALLSYDVGAKALGNNYAMYSLFVVWQAAMACLLGWIMIWAEGADTARRAAAR